MSYTPTNWQTGDVVTSVKLNKLEDGVKGAYDEIAESISRVDDRIDGLESITSPQTYINLYNPNDPDILTGKQIKSSGEISNWANGAVSGYIPVKPGKTYKFPVLTHHFGTGGAVKNIAAYNSDKEYIGYVSGTLFSINGVNAFLTLTLGENYNSRYIRITTVVSDANLAVEILSPFHSKSNFMVIEGDSFPDRFYPYVQQPIADANIYSGHENLNNPLYGKRAVFIGDSICEGDSGKGYAGRVGLANTMLWENDGISGSTISTVQASKPICTRSVLTENPDYIILEGGTNDADIIGDATGDTKPAAFGTWDEDEYGTDDTSTYYGFDVSTFCGSVDYMCKRFVSTYPSAKIGFIGAQKMGTVADTRANRGYYIHTAMEICRKWGIPCLNLWDESHLNPLIPSHYTNGETYMYSDGQHLTANGYDYISPIVNAWMKTL